MDISLDLKGAKDTRLYLVAKRDIDDVYLLVKDFNSGIDNPVLYLVLKDSKFTIDNKKSQIDKVIDKDISSKLDMLALKVIEAVQNGEDINDTVVEEEKPYDPSKIRCETRNLSLKQVYDMIVSETQDIDLHPEFQRNLVWDNQRKSRLIESVMLGVPLPMFYFAEDDNGQLGIIDGLQRLNAIYEFMSGKLTLTGLEYLNNCNGQTFKKLDVKYLRRINMTQISCNVILPESPSEVKYNIFRRINTGGYPLNAQELRNCMSGQRLRECLKMMVESAEFTKATLGSVKDVRMDAQELALRFIYFRRLLKFGSLDDYNGNIDIELDKLTDLLKRASQEEFMEYLQSFKSSMKFAEHLFGEHAFRRIFLSKKDGLPTKRSIINKAVFSSISVLLSFASQEILQMPKNCLVVPFGKAMAEDEDYKRYLSYGTNGKQNIIYSFEKAKSLLDTNLNIALNIPVISKLLLNEIRLLKLKQNESAY